MKLTKKDKVLGIGAFAIIGFVVIYGLVMDMLSFDRTEPTFTTVDGYDGKMLRTMVDIECLNFDTHSYEVQSHIYIVDERGRYIRGANSIPYNTVFNITTSNIDSVYYAEVNRLEQMIADGLTYNVNTTVYENERLDKLRHDSY